MNRDDAYAILSAMIILIAVSALVAWVTYLAL
jgi:hypothetical protein